MPQTACPPAAAQAFTPSSPVADTRAAVHAIDPRAQAQLAQCERLMQDLRWVSQLLQGIEAMAPGLLASQAGLGRYGGAPMGFGAGVGGAGLCATAPQNGPFQASRWSGGLGQGGALGHCGASGPGRGLAGTGLLGTGLPMGGVSGAPGSNPFFPMAQLPTTGHLGAANPFAGATYPGAARCHLPAGAVPFAPYAAGSSYSASGRAGTGPSAYRGYAGPAAYPPAGAFAAHTAYSPTGAFGARPAYPAYAASGPAYAPPGAPAAGGYGGPSYGAVSNGGTVARCSSGSSTSSLLKKGALIGAAGVGGALAASVVAPLALGVAATALFSPFSVIGAGLAFSALPCAGLAGLAACAFL